MNAPTRAIRAAVLSAGMAACAAPLDLEPGQRPPPGTLEAGLWMQMDRVEENLRNSGRIVHDETLKEYVRAIVCALSPEYCPQIRIYIVETPNFNASMAASGVMEVWTGLILRAQNEAQLAFVLAHEIAHFQRRHTLQAFESAIRKTTGLAFFQIAAAAAGVGYAGDLAALFTSASILAFSREKEAEADALGLQLMTRAGYDPREASKMWETLLAERDASRDEKGFVPPIFLSTHPSETSRARTLSELATGLPEGGTGVERFRTVTLPGRSEWLRDELRSRRFLRTQWLLGQLLERNVNPAEIEFFYGELYRTRGEPGDAEIALDWYGSAAERADPPPETFRGIGVLQRRAGDLDGARKAFARYLELNSEASDRAMIESYLEELKEPQ